MINYASTDNSVNIIKEICPSWAIVDSVNEHFIDEYINREVKTNEKDINGWRICLNVTEFILGDFSLIKDTPEKKYFMAPVISIIDEMEIRDSTSIDKNIPLHDQIKTGLNLQDSIVENAYRCFANYTQWFYPPGRHFKVGKEFNVNETTEYPFIILKYKYAPMTEEFIKRKLQIQNKIPYKEQKIFRNGDYHTDFGKGLTKEKILETHRSLKKENLSTIIDYYLKLCYI